MSTMPRGAKSTAICAIYHREGVSGSWTDEDFTKSKMRWRISQRIGLATERRGTTFTDGSIWRPGRGQPKREDHIDARQPLDSRRHRLDGHLAVALSRRSRCWSARWLRRRQPRGASVSSWPWIEHGTREWGCLRRISRPSSAFDTEEAQLSGQGRNGRGRASVSTICHCPRFAQREGWRRMTASIRASPMMPPNLSRCPPAPGRSSPACRSRQGRRSFPHG